MTMSEREYPANKSVQPSDIISGRLYLKLIADYKEYDKRQKEYIHELESKIISISKALKKEYCDVINKNGNAGRIEDLMDRIEDNYADIIAKDKDRQDYIEELQNRISDLTEALTEIANTGTLKQMDRITNQRLTLKRQAEQIYSLTEENKRLKQELLEIREATK